MARIAFVLLLHFATTAFAGVLTWSSSGPESGVVNFVRFDPSNPAIVWVATQTEGVFRSTDAGLSWTSASQGLDPDISSIVVDPSSSSIAYAGSSFGNVFKTTDAGVTWTRISNQLSDGAPITAMVIDPKTPSTLYASTTSLAIYMSRGVFKSTNSGQTWVASDSGLGTKNVYCITIDPQNQGEPAYEYLKFPSPHSPRSSRPRVLWEPGDRLFEEPGVSFLEHPGGLKD